MLQGCAAAGAVVALDGGEHVTDRKPVTGQRLRRDLDLVRLQLTAIGVYVDDAGHLAQARGDLPVEDGAQIHPRGVAPAHLELVDLAEAGGDRPELRRR